MSKIKKEAAVQQKIEVLFNGGADGYSYRRRYMGLRKLNEVEREVSMGGRRAERYVKVETCNGRTVVLKKYVGVSGKKLLSREVIS
jgi:hypothetical protein